VGRRRVPQRRPVTLIHPCTRGPNVRALQNALRSGGYDFGPSDGVYGPLTAGAVELFKIQKGIEPWSPHVDLPVYYVLGNRCEPHAEKVAQEHVIACSVRVHGQRASCRCSPTSTTRSPASPRTARSRHPDFVIAPPDYLPNTIRSAQQARDSGYPIAASDRRADGPILWGPACPARSAGGACGRGRGRLPPSRGDLRARAS